VKRKIHPGGKNPLTAAREGKKMLTEGPGENRGIGKQHRKQFQEKRKKKRIFDYVCWEGSKPSARKRKGGACGGGVTHTAEGKGPGSQVKKRKPFNGGRIGTVRHQSFCQGSVKRKKGGRGAEQTQLDLRDEGKKRKTSKEGARAAPAAGAGGKKSKELGGKRRI